MFWTEQKLEKRIQELKEYRYRDTISISEFEYQVDDKKKIGEYPPSDGKWDKIKIGERWKGRDLYLWLSTDVNIPSQWCDKKIIGKFNFGKTGGGHNSGFESLLFLNGKPYQGVDSNHQQICIPARLAGTTINLSFRLWSGLEGGGKPVIQEHLLETALLAWLDESVDDLYYTGRAVLETVNVLSQKDPVKNRLLKLLNDSFNLLDWSYPGSQEFYHSVKEALEFLKNDLEQLEKKHPVTVNCIGHTHIDVAWLWRLRHTREKCARSFSTVLRLMEEYPEYIFLQSQPQLYQYIKKDYPEIYSEIKKRVSEGRWEVDGAMWVEADCNISSGESLVRQILYGKRFFREEFNTECKYLWLPDVFGYSWALPQILKKSGIETFMTTKISWNQYNKMPHDTFIWRGIDGSEVLTHFITTPEIDQPDDKWWYTYNGQINPETIDGIWSAYSDKDINQELLLSYGYGDGGGGVNRQMLEMRRRLDEIPGLPQVKTGRVDEFFDQLHEKVDKTDQYVHTWNGELYLEYHRGTYTSQAYNKRKNRKLELLYRDTEWLSILKSLFAEDFSIYPVEALKQGWQIILRNQFHDIIPGSSIHEVYEDCLQEYAEAQELALNQLDESYLIVTDDNKSIDSKDNNNRKSNGRITVKESESDDKEYDGKAKEKCFTVFNSGCWEYSGIVTISRNGMKDGYWYSAEGEELESENSGTDWCVYLEKIPSMGFVKIIYRSENNRKYNDKDEKNIVEINPIRVNINKREIITPFYHIEWNKAGQLTSIYDRQYQRQVIANNSCGNVLQVFEDKPLQFDAWDIDSFYQEKMREVDDLQSVKVIQKGHLRCIIHFEWTYMNSVIKQDLIVYRDKRRIDFRTNVDWHEQQQLMKVAFPVDIHSDVATYDIQFGNVERPTHWNTSWDFARFESVGHWWVDLSERNYGVSLLNDCKYGHDIKDNVIRLSLIKSAIRPDIKADQGQHQFTYALYPHCGDWYQGNTVQEAWYLNNPLSYSPGKPVCDKFSSFKISTDNVMIDAVKKAEDKECVLLRVHEFSGSRGPVIISSDFNILSWQECSLMEKPINDKVTDDKLEFEIKPYEIKTFLIEMEG